MDRRRGGGKGRGEDFFGGNGRNDRQDAGRGRREGAPRYGEKRAPSAAHGYEDRRGRGDFRDDARGNFRGELRRDERRSVPPRDGQPRRAVPPARPVPPARMAPTVRPAAPAPVPPAPYRAPEPEMPENLLVGRNPIREAIRAGQPLEKLLVQKGELSGSAREIVAKAREAGVVIQYVERARLDAIYPNHQGLLAYASAAEYADVEDILAAAREAGEDPFIVALDGVTDPHNLGAIIRSAECCGAHGVIVPERRSAGLNPAAVKAAAGALAYQKVARVTNLVRTLEDLKQKGLWIVGTDTGAEDIATADLTGPVVLVIGSEGEGLSHLMRECCDRMVSIPMKGHIDSLNASVAAGVAMYQVMRAREG